MAARCIGCKKEFNRQTSIDKLYCKECSKEEKDQTSKTLKEQLSKVKVKPKNA